ncbi:MAG: TVP38/TMEM64 family protein [Bacillota bacterium]|nr:TVP38/TMEM64 family protein [Bacillota bacterium]MDP4154139.1 TVP38/TMEM64 family protein [Bacillota bacterium]
MKKFMYALIRLIAAAFLFFLLGMAIVLIVDQSQWIDMRFDSEYLVTIATLTGFWFYFLSVFLNAKNFAFWESKRKSSVLFIASIGIILFLTLKNGSFAILPAYTARKALFLEDALSLEIMNKLLIVIFVIGAAALGISLWKQPLSKIENGWYSLSRSRKLGMQTLFTMIALFLLFYLGQGTIQSSINHSISFLKDADVLGFKNYLLSFGPMAAVVSAFLMVFQSIVAPLPAFVITFANGLLFGWIFGAILSWSSAMLGAILCFYVAKFLGRPVVEKMVTKKALQWWDRFFDKYGKHAVFIARLLPIVSFDLVSYAAGVTSISFWEFFWATGLGQLPATILYSYLGQNATSTVKILFFLFTIVIALAVIGVILSPKWKSRKGKQGDNA